MHFSRRITIKMNLNNAKETTSLDMFPFLLVYDYYPACLTFNILGLLICEVCIARFELLVPSFNLSFVDCSFTKKFVDIAKWLCYIPTFLEVVKIMRRRWIWFSKCIFTNWKRGLFLWKKLNKKPIFKENTGREKSRNNYALIDINSKQRTDSY